MFSPPSPAPGASTDARPVDASERVVLLDVLRGFALGGVFISNAYMHLSGRGLLPRASEEALKATKVDVVADFLFELPAVGVHVPGGVHIEVERVLVEAASVVGPAGVDWTPSWQWDCVVGAWR
jgi:hypothetical protein